MAWEKFNIKVCKPDSPIVLNRYCLLYQAIWDFGFFKDGIKNENN